MITEIIIIFKNDKLRPKKLSMLRMIIFELMFMQFDFGQYEYVMPNVPS